MNALRDLRDLAAWLAGDALRALAARVDPGGELLVRARASAASIEDPPPTQPSGPRTPISPAAAELLAKPPEVVVSGVEPPRPTGRRVRAGDL